MMCDAKENSRQEAIQELQDVGLTLLAQLKNAGGRAFESLGLSYGQAMLMIFVERGHTSPSELAKLLDVVGPALSVTVTGLAEKDLVERQGVKSDARRVVVTLTPRGVLACKELRKAWAENYPIDLSSFSDDDLETFIKAGRIAAKSGLI